MQCTFCAEAHYAPVVASNQRRPSLFFVVVVVVVVLRRPYTHSRILAHMHRNGGIACSPSYQYIHSTST